MSSYPHHHAQGESCSALCCLRVENLGLQLEESVILQDISFHLHCGEIMALIGPNGAGKTSLLQSILGQMPYSGEIAFTSAGGLPSRPMIGYVPQSPRFDPGDPVTVLDFFTAAISSWPIFLPIPKRLREQLRRSLARVQADALLYKRIGSLSGGELQRVLLALALEPPPHILILDEPLSGVDIEGELQLMELLLTIRQEYDLSILFSTHDFATLERYADKVILLQNRMRKIGSPAEVLHSPEFAETFHLTGSPRKEGWSE